jgi:hypothetical protein
VRPKISGNSTVSAARDRPYVATPLGVQRARPSLQLDETKIIALVGCPATHVVRRQHHCQRCKRGQLLPRMLCRSTSVFRFGGLPCESRGSQVVPPDAVRGRMNRRLLFHFELGRLFNRRPFVFQLLGHSCCTAMWRYRRQYRQCSESL